MSFIDLPGEAMVRKADDPPQPTGTRWIAEQCHG